MPPATIITDLDGTLVNVMTQVLRFFSKVFGVHLAPDFCTEYNVAASLWKLPAVRDIFCDREALEDVLQRNLWQNPEAYSLAEPYWDWHRALQCFVEGGGELIALTSRPPTPAINRATERWLEQWNYDESCCELLFSQAWEHGKLEALRELTGEASTRAHRYVWFVDDDLELCKQVAEERLKGVDIFTPPRPWTTHGKAQPIDPAALLVAAY